MKNQNVLKKLAVLSLAAVMSLGTLAGCSASGSTKDSTADAGADSSAAEDSAEESTEDSGVEKKELLVVSFGTSYNSSRSVTIGAIESSLAEAFPEYEVKRAFTSQTIIDKLADRDGITIMNVEEALEDAYQSGVTTLVIQPTHLMSGYEYTDLAEAASEYEDKFDELIMSTPLLTTDSDYEAVAQAVYEKTASYDDGETAICLMGHGTEADSNSDYATLQEKFTELGYDNIYVGTVEATPSCEDLIASLQEKGTYTKVVLLPLMVVAGDHANNDMAGDEEDSWKSLFTAAGYDVTCILEGLGQDYNIQQIYVSHVKGALGE